MIAADAIALWGTRRVTRAVLLSAGEELELSAEGWTIARECPQRWRDPATGEERTPTSALRAARGDRARRGA